MGLNQRTARNRGRSCKPDLPCRPPQCICHVIDARRQPTPTNPMNHNACWLRQIALARAPQSNLKREARWNVIDAFAPLGPHCTGVVGLVACSDAFSRLPAPLHPSIVIAVTLESIYTVFGVCLWALSVRFTATMSELCLLFLL